MVLANVLLMLRVAVCKYTKSTISECDPETHMRTITRDLIADESGANCDAQKLKTQVCSADGGSRRRERNRQRQAAKQERQRSNKAAKLQRQQQRQQAAQAAKDARRDKEKARQRSKQMRRQAKRTGGYYSECRHTLIFSKPYVIN